MTCLRDAAPEDLQRSAGAVVASFQISVGQRRGIHRAGRRAGNAVDPQPWLLEEPIQHAPREGAMGAAALQRKIDQNGFAIAHGSDIRRGSFIVRP